jgi:hypothetical protein
VGWISGLSLLASVRARYIPMAPSTALCFCLIGAGIILHLKRPLFPFLPNGLAFVVLLVAVAKLLEFFIGPRFGIDTWLVRNPGTFGAVPTGRMAPLTAADFVITSAGLFCLTNITLRKWAGCFGTLATIIGAVVLVGYWYGTPLLYGGNVIPVALSTGWAFFLSGIAILAAAGAEIPAAALFWANQPLCTLTSHLCPGEHRAALKLTAGSSRTNPALLMHWARLSGLSP